MVEFADGSGVLVILPACSSLANVSLAFLCWVTVSQLVCHKKSAYDLLWCLMACVSVIAVNVTWISVQLPCFYWALDGKSRSNPTIQTIWRTTLSNSLNAITLTSSWPTRYWITRRSSERPQPHAICRSRGLPPMDRTEISFGILQQAQIARSSSFAARCTPNSQYYGQSWTTFGPGFCANLDWLGRLPPLSR